MFFIMKRREPHLRGFAKVAELRQLDADVEQSRSYAEKEDINPSLTFSFVCFPFSCPMRSWRQFGADRGKLTMKPSESNITREEDS